MSKSYWRRAASLVAFVVMAALALPATAGAAGGSPARERTYLVTIENLTIGQPFTPPVLATHQRSAPVFTSGTAASPGLQGLAENGGVPGLVAELTSDPGVRGVFVADANGPVLPGGSISLEVTSERGARKLSIASMLICTNDGFVGLDSFPLPTQGGAPSTVYLNSYDAGTEINTEDFDDLVPPCGPLTGAHDGSLGTGATNPALAEGGVVTRHAGIGGGADLEPATHDWADPVARVTITRIDNVAEYRVTIANSTSGQPFTPPVIAAHSPRVDIYSVGSAASPAIQGLAENGDVPGLVDSLAAGGGVGGGVLGDAPVLPGGEVTYTFYAPNRTRFVSYASMLICTNDGFAGVDGLRLPRHVGSIVTRDLNAYDAGTELNTEEFADLVPPCGPLTGAHDGSIGTGASNPALAEGGVIALHGGVSGGAGLDPAVHGWSGPVGTFTIERIG